MPKLHSAVIGLVFAALAVAAGPAAADGYLKGPKAHRYAPGPELIVEPDGDAVVYSYSEVRVRYRNAPVYGYGAAYLPGPPDLWRQRQVAYESIFTQERRIVYDSGLAAESRAAAAYYAPRALYRAPAWPAYGSIKDYGPPPVRVVEPVVDLGGGCGTFRFWDGGRCIDARFHSRYKNPYRRIYPPW